MGSDSGAVIVSHYVVTVKPPATPLPAATLVLLRDRPGGIAEVLLIRRHLKSKFAGGDYVFPGGKVERADCPEDVGVCSSGPGVEEASRRLGRPGDANAIAYWNGALREAFEEVGVLLAERSDGAPPCLPPARLAEYRRACQADDAAFWAMLREEKLRLATDRLVYFAHWITPEERPYRFDTRFFAAAMPPGQEAVADDHEIIDVRWLTPSEALAGLARGEITLRLPTMRNLGLMRGDFSLGELLRRLGSRPVPTIRPRLVRHGETERPLLPGDPGWH